MKCPSCGASIVDDSLTCAYCNQPTPAALAARQAEADAVRAREAAEDAHDLAQDAKRIETARKSVSSSGTWSVLWSVVGFLTCIIPVLSIVGILMSVRARRLARQFDLVVPSSVTAGGILGGVGLGFGVIFWIIGSVGIIEVSKRKDTLRETIAAGDTKEQLDAPTACALAEYGLLTEGWAKHRGTSIDDFTCTGRVTQNGDLAEIDDVVFHSSSTSRWDLKACFKRGTRWSLKGFRETKGCDEEEEPPAKEER